MLTDLRTIIRSLGRQRAFTLVVVLTLAIGIGGATAIFTLTEWTLFRRGSYPADIFMVCVRADAGAGLSTAMNDYMMQGYVRTEALRDVAKSAWMSGNVVIDGQPVGTGWLGITPNVFPLFNVTPVLGRNFVAGEDKEGADSAVIISYRFWRQRFDGSNSVIGRKITLGTSICTVVGVLGEDPALPPFLNNNIYRPLTYRVDPDRPWIPPISVLARLRPGVSPEQATQMLNAAELDIPAGLRAFTKKPQALLASLPEMSAQMEQRSIYWVLLAAVGFLYGIACLNASNLMLVRMLGQQRELSIRLAIGAERWRIVRLLALESLTLAVAGCIGGILIAHWCFPLLLHITSSAIFNGDWSGLSLSGTQIAVMSALTVLTSLIIVAVPAFRVLRGPITFGLKEGGGAVGESRPLARLRAVLVIAQAALAVTLLAGAGLMIRTVDNLQHIDLGFQGAGRLKIYLGLPAGYPNEHQARLARLHEVQAVIQRVPGVDSVGFGDDVMLPGYFVGTHPIEAAGGVPVKAMVRGISTGFEATSGLELKRGRPLTHVHDAEILVSEALARACWPGEDPIGKIMRPAGGAHGDELKGWIVIGVVADMRISLRAAPSLVFYCDEGWYPGNFNRFVVKGSVTDWEALGGKIRRELYAYDPEIVVQGITSLDGLRDSQLYIEHMTEAVLQVLAGTAAILTFIGIFSVLAYTVDRRMGEFGVRLAFGATPRHLMRLVIRRGVALAAVGVALGLGTALALSRSLGSVLYGISANDPGVMLAVSIAMLLTAALGCIVPAYRASKADVVRLLRSE